MLALRAAFDPGGEMFVPSAAKRGRPRKTLPVKPIAPFDTDHAKAIALAFARETGAPVTPSSLATYADALAAYHLSPEDKFLNGEYFDKGTTQRRHIRIIGIRHIGKEAHDWAKRAILGTVENTNFAYQPVLIQN